MKIGKHFSFISALLVVAGCSHHEQARYTDYGTPYSTGGSTSSYQQSTGTAQQTTSSNPASQATSETDRNLVSQVQQSLRQDNALAGLMPAIQISAQNGSVTIAGNVSSEQEKQKIESAVKSTSGVATVNNQLQVAGSPTSDRPGQGTRLYQESNPATTPTSKPDSSTSTAPTTPDVSKSDTAPSPTTPAPAATPTTDTALSPTSQPGAANRIYSETNASSTSENLSLNVQGSTEADRSLGQKIQQEVRADTNLAGQLSAIKMNVDNGKITLTGTVRSEDQKQAIEKAAQRVTGVTSIDNQLQVSGSATDASTDTSAPAPQK